MRHIRSLGRIVVNLVRFILVSGPNDRLFCSARVRFHRWLGFAIDRDAILYRNVNLVGRISIGAGSSVSDNTCLNGGHEGIEIGRNVMIAPGCVIVAFEHGVADLTRPMVQQPWVCSKVVIEDDVWIGANATITKGVRIRTGSIVGAGAVVNRDVESYSIVAGVPARPIGHRATGSSCVSSLPDNNE